MYGVSDEVSADEEASLEEEATEERAEAVADAPLSHSGSSA